MAEQAQKDSERKVKVASKTAGEGTQPQIRWDDSQMASSYANVVNATSTREEVTLFFGTNRTWSAAEIGNVVVSLSNRIILNPHAAKRLLTLLAAVLAEYERRYGAVNISPRQDQLPES
jgi:Protein of unknown function (DUF3467)